MFYQVFELQEVLEQKWKYELAFLDVWELFIPLSHVGIISWFPFSPAEFYRTNIHTEHIILLKVFRDQDLNTGLILPTSGIKEGQALSWSAEVESSNPVFTVELARI